MEQPQDPGKDEPQQNPQSERLNLQNTTPAFILDCLYFGFLEKYGWFFVIGLIVLAFLWYKLRPQIRKLQRRWEEQRDIANFDPQRAASQQERMEETRRRWQEVQEAKAAYHLEKKKLLEEEKRQEKIEDWERHQQGKGYRSKKPKPTGEDSASQNMLKPKKKPLRDSDHSPLSGGGGGASYRPPRRGTGGGG